KRLVDEFTFRAEHAYDYAMPQWLAKLDKACAKARLERLFLGRHKFHHFRLFYPEELANYVKEGLLDTRTLRPPIFCRANIEKKLRQHLSGSGNYTREIHKLLSLELLSRQLLDQN